METKFIRPKFKRRVNPSGVYKIIFDNTFFYIGGSKKIKSRFAQWKTLLRSGKNKNNKIRELFKNTKLVEFKILEITPKEHNPKDREDYYLKKFWGNSKLLNKSPSAYNNLGCKPFVLKMPPKNPIAVFDINWNFLEKFDYLSHAAKKVKCDSSDISDFIKGRSMQVKGYKFKKILPDGSYSEPILFVSKKPPLKPKKIRGLPSLAKPVIKYSISGIELERFPSSVYAADSIGTKCRTFRRWIQQTHTGYHKGFIWKYA